MLIDLALSGDNAIVIGMAAAALPRRQRKLAILAGAGLAIVLRVALTTVTTLPLMVPLLSAVGGVALFWVAWRLLRMDTGTESDDGTRAGRAGDRLRDVVAVIVTADVSMSMDNVIAGWARPMAASSSSSPGCS